MAKQRVFAGLALSMFAFAGCVQFEMGPMTTTDTADPPESTGDEKPPPTVACDPLGQDCPDLQACSLVGGDFICIDVAIQGGVGDVCQAAGECAAGFLCRPAVVLDGCEGGSCCSPLCDVGDGAGQCGSGAEACVAVFGSDAPPMWADYGVCQLPG